MNKLALKGGEPVRKEPFPSYPNINKEEINAVNEVLKSKELSTFHSSFYGGKKVREFEEDFAKYHNIKYAIASNSGTAALHIAIAAAGIGPGDEVITTPYTFTATATSILMHNAIPIFVDIDQNTLCIDPEEIRKKITPKTKAITIVHLLGNVADMDEITKIAKEHNLIIIEDCAQAPGAKYKGRLVGTIGDLGTFSFQETKNIMTGEGGITITNDQELAKKCQLIRNHGEDCSREEMRKYISNTLGWNYRMTEMEAALGIVQLKKLDKFNEIRKHNAQFLNKEFENIKGISPILIEDGAEPVYHLYGLTFNENKVGIPRDLFIKALKAEGIEVSPGCSHPLYMNPLFLNKTAYGKGCPFICKFYNKEIEYQKGLCPKTEEACKSAIWLNQIRPPATLEDMQDIIKAFKKIIENKNEL